MIIMNVLDDGIFYYPEVCYLHLIVSYLFTLWSFSFLCMFFYFFWDQWRPWFIKFGNLLSFLSCFIFGIVWSCFSSTFCLRNMQFDRLPVSIRAAFYKLLPACFLSIWKTDLSSIDFIWLCFILLFVGITNIKFQQDLPNQKYEGKWQFAADSYEMIDCCYIPFPPLLSSYVVFW